MKKEEPECGKHAFWFLFFSSGQATWQRAKGHPHVRSLRQGKSGTAIFVDSMDIPILVFR